MPLAFIFGSFAGRQGSSARACAFDCVQARTVLNPRQLRELVVQVARLVLLVAFVALRSTGASAQSQPSTEMFSGEKVKAGIRISETDCRSLAAQHTGVWVDADGEGLCLRYYAAGLKIGSPNRIAAVWLHGDIMGSMEGGVGHQKGLGVAAMIDQERRLSQRFSVPFLFIGRPGAYGSGGDYRHTWHSPHEANLINAGLDALKRRYNVAAWALGGHSAGGTLSAELMSRRADLRCVVISSGAAAYRARLEARALKSELAHHEWWFDPYESLDRIQRDPARRIFMIGDPREKNIPFTTQRLYFDGLKARGNSVWLMPLKKAAPPTFHSLVDFGETATGMCARGDSTAAIVETLNRMPDQSVRISN